MNIFQPVLVLKWNLMKLWISWTLIMHNVCGELQDCEEEREPISLADARLSLYNTFTNFWFDFCTKNDKQVFTNEYLQTSIYKQVLYTVYSDIQCCSSKIFKNTIFEKYTSIEYKKNKAKNLST